MAPKEIMQARILELDDLVCIIKDEIDAAKEASDTCEEFDLRRELERTIDARRKLASEVYLMKNPHKTAAAHKRVRCLCPDCNRYYMAPAATEVA